MSRNGTTRRSVLRSIAAVSAGVALPALGLSGLTGCEQKTPEAGQAASEPQSEAPATENKPTPEDDGTVTPGKASSKKMTKIEADYQSLPKGDQDCANCLHFLAKDNSCQLVEGSVGSPGWCKLWVTTSS